MKIIESNYDYELEARNQIEHFTIELTSLLWKFLPHVEREKYYKINRGVSDLVDKLVSTLGCQYEIDAQDVARANIPDEYFVSVLADGLVRELMKSDIAYIIKRNTLMGGNKFVVTIPFIKTVRIPNTLITTELKND